MILIGSSTSGNLYQAYSVLIASPQLPLLSKAVFIKGIVTLIEQHLVTLNEHYYMAG